MKTSDLAAMPRSERAIRTYERIVYRKLVDLQTAIREARRQGSKLGILDELDTQNLINQFTAFAGIEYRSIEENPSYEKPVLPDAKAVEHLPIIDVSEDNF